MPDRRKPSNEGYQPQYRGYQPQKPDTTTETPEPLSGYMPVDTGDSSPENSNPPGDE